MNKLISFLFLLQLNSCTNNFIRKGDTIYIQFKIIDNKGLRIDENSIIDGNKLPLKVIVGKNYLPKVLENEIIGKEYEKTICIKLRSDRLYKNDLFYVYCSDTNFLMRKNEKITIMLTAYRNTTDFPK